MDFIYLYTCQVFGFQQSDYFNRLEKSRTDIFVHFLDGLKMYGFIYYNSQQFYTVGTQLLN